MASNRADMKILRATLESCTDATGLVVVIDVLRAFTTTAYAFVAGADQITIVGTVEEAFAIKNQRPEVILMGEMDGRPIEGFDLSNSPSALIDLDLTDKHLVHRSTLGTQGVVRSDNASNILTASLCCASATVRYIKKLTPTAVTLIETGVQPDGWGDEDVACGDLIESLLLNKPYDLDEIKRRVQTSRAGVLFQDSKKSVFPLTDLECALAIDSFDFVMLVSRQNRQMVLKAIP